MASEGSEGVLQANLQMNYIILILCTCAHRFMSMHIHKSVAICSMCATEYLLNSRVLGAIKIRSLPRVIGSGARY